MLRVRSKCQNKAKVWADANIVKLVFVINDTETDRHLRKNAAAWSRLATPVVVEDLGRDEALAFLGEPYLMEQDQLSILHCFHTTTPKMSPKSDPT